MEINLKFTHQVYLNGTFVPKDQAKISIFDRGLSFSDGVYEVIPAYANKFVEFDQHLDRLKFGLNQLEIPIPEVDWKKVAQELIRIHKPDTFMMYLAITRGETPLRNHLYRETIVKPTTFAYLQPILDLKHPQNQKPITAITCEDIRWLRCEIKSIGLLPNILWRQKAHDQGAGEAIFIRDGRVMEGTSTNVFICTNGTVKTPKANGKILDGVTRRIFLQLTKLAGLDCLETDIFRDELFAAEEVWVTSSTRGATAVTAIDGKAIGRGEPGPVTFQLKNDYSKYVSEKGSFI